MRQSLRNALLLLAALAWSSSALGADVATGYSAGPGGYYKPADRSGPYSIDSAGNATLIGSGGGGGGGSATVTGSQEQDARSTATLDATVLNSSVVIPLNGQSTVGLRFSGLTGSGAVVTFEQSNDGGGTYTGVNEVNAGTGVPTATRNTDGQTRVAVQGRTNLRIRVTTVGTGTISLAWNVSVREGLVTLASPLPPGSNNIGFTSEPPGIAVTTSRTTGVGTTGALVSAADATNRRTVTNTSGIACEIMGSAAAYGTGYPLPAGGSFTFDASGRTTAALYVACASAGGTVAVISY